MAFCVGITLGPELNVDRIGVTLASAVLLNVMAPQKVGKKR
jgi:hypothetical protein